MSSRADRYPRKGCNSDVMVDLKIAFKRFSQLEAKGQSNLYEYLTLEISKDPELLQIASVIPPEQPAPNLFLAAVHWLLMKNSNEPLTNYYPHLSHIPSPDKGSYDVFRRFVLRNRDKIQAILREKKVQTCVVERCGILLPAFATIAARNPGKSLALVEFGAAAGLNLFWDKYKYTYLNSDITIGPSESKVSIETKLRGMYRPAMFSNMPTISHRVGIDLSPIDVFNADHCSWLKALLWPQEKNNTRLYNLTNAIDQAKLHRPKVYKGDAINLLPDILYNIPLTDTLIVYNTHTLNQFAETEQVRLNQIMDNVGKRRNFYWVSSEYRSSVNIFDKSKGLDTLRPTLLLSTFTNGERFDETLAKCHHHGAWLEWFSK